LTEIAISIVFVPHPMVSCSFISLLNSFKVSRRPPFCNSIQNLSLLTRPLPSLILQRFETSSCYPSVSPHQFPNHSSCSPDILGKSGELPMLAANIHCDFNRHLGDLAQLSNSSSSFIVFPLSCRFPRVPLRGIQSHPLLPSFTGYPSDRFFHFFRAE
jgi:hypothetical protein